MSIINRFIGEASNNVPYWQKAFQDRSKFTWLKKAGDKNVFLASIAVTGIAVLFAARGMANLYMGTGKRDRAIAERL
eukprot:CAMPEP_0170739310 /NCGR_PEP_ID=MMETSP0437-20130122/5097_1 /TAXON_ID=0 /ORGANISM="Sexangularia sp." /LENGTH=76 /DNA_ID=CAMNT_0011077765 /DNA_START=79 /DNA_END=309 /DNA_ORIENTATION=+